MEAGRCAEDVSRQRYGRLEDPPVPFDVALGQLAQRRGGSRGDRGEDAEQGVALALVRRGAVAVTLDQLKVLQLEIINSGNLAYQQKWKIRDAIAKAKTKEELEAITIKFTPADFTASA